MPKRQGKNWKHPAGVPICPKDRAGIKKGAQNGKAET